MPSFGEIVKKGSKTGTFLGQRGKNFCAVLWNGERDPVWEADIFIQGTGKKNEAWLEEIGKNISSRVNRRRKGGLRTGKRFAPGDPRQSHEPVEDEQKKEVST